MNELELNELADGGDPYDFETMTDENYVLVGEVTKKMLVWANKEFGEMLGAHTPKIPWQHHNKVVAENAALFVVNEILNPALQRVATTTAIRTRLECAERGWEIADNRAKYYKRLVKLGKPVGDFTPAMAELYMHACLGVRHEFDGERNLARARAAALKTGRE